MLRKAEIHGDFRYSLFREWDGRAPRLCWVMLNPSTADGETDDPTVRKCVQFARRWKFGGIEIVNLLAYRATDPRQLLLQPWQGLVGGENDRFIANAVHNADATVVAWGAWGSRFAARVDEVRGLIEEEVAGRNFFDGEARPVWTLGTTSQGCPRHPLMLPYSTPRQYFYPRTAESR